jgi:hypothetical protein
MPRTIDLAWAGIEADGTSVYAPPPEAAMRLAGQGLGWLLVQYPHQTIHGLVLATVGVACAYLTYENLAPKRSRQK